MTKHVSTVSKQEFNVTLDTTERHQRRVYRQPAALGYR